MRLDAFLYTNAGGREQNEDSARWNVKEDAGFFLVADGLGGHRGVEIASALAADSLNRTWLDESEPPEDRAAWLREEILRANGALLAEQEARHASMKTTVAALAADGERIAWAHVGDSRIYALSDGRVRRLTQDHSVSYKKYLAGEITRNAVNFDEDRPSLLRVVGEESRCVPDTGSGSLFPGDGFLLCSDGFWEYVYDEEILIDFLKAGTPREWAELLLLRVLPRLRPGNDNLTLLAVCAG